MFLMSCYKKKEGLREVRAISEIASNYNNQPTGPLANNADRVSFSIFHSGSFARADHIVVCIPEEFIGAQRI